MEEEDHFTQTQLPALIAALAAAALAAAALDSPSFSLGLLHSALTLSNFVALSRCSFIGKNGATSFSSSSTMMTAKVNSWCHLFATH